MAFQRATLYWAKKIASIAISAPPVNSQDYRIGVRTIQDGITPPWLAITLLTTYALIVSAIIMGVHQLGWLGGFGGLLGGFIATCIFQKLWPPVHSNFYRRQFIRSFKRHAQWFAATGNKDREQAANDCISILEDVGHTEDV